MTSHNINHERARRHEGIKLLVLQFDDQWHQTNLNFSNRVNRYRYHTLRKASSKFYRRHHELVSKYNVGLKSLSEPEFYGDLVYKFKNIMGRTDFSHQFRKIIICHKRIGYDLNVMRQSACLVINPIRFDNFAAFFSCTPEDRSSDSMMSRPKAIHFSWLDQSSFVCCLVHRGSTDARLLVQISIRVVWQTRDLHLSRNRLYLSSPRYCFFIVLERNLLFTVMEH